MEPLPSDMQHRAQKNAQASDSGLGFFLGSLLGSELFCLALLASPSTLAVLWEVSQPLAPWLVIYKCK